MAQDLLEPAPCNRSRTHKIVLSVKVSAGEKNVNLSNQMSYCSTNIFYGVLEILNMLMIDLTGVLFKARLQS